MACPARFGDVSLIAVRPAAAFAEAGFRRWATYRQAAVAGVFVNTVFGVIKLSILLAVAKSAGGSVAGYDPEALSTYAWVSQAMIAFVMVFTDTELSDRVKTGDIAVDLARPVDLQLSWLAADLGRAAWALVSRGIVPIAFGATFFGFHVPSNPTAIVLLVPSLVLAVVVSFALRFMLNLTAFWLTEIRGIVLLYVFTSGLLAGHLIPTQLFPGWLHTLAYATPFPALIQTPIDLTTGLATGTHALRLVAAQVAWAMILLALGRVVQGRATRRLVVQGG